MKCLDSIDIYIGVQVANYYRNDIAWDPSVPPGHSVYTWTGVSTVSARKEEVYVPLQIQAYASQMKAAAAELAVSQIPIASIAPGKSKEEKKEKVPVKVDALPTTGPGAFYRLDIRAGKIVEVNRHPDADKLYVEKIDVGEAQPRTIVSGLVQHVPIDQMLGANVFVICNLKPSKLKGVESQGMVLCASNADKSKVELVVPAEGTSVGERVLLEGNEISGKVDTEINLKKDGNAWELTSKLLKTDATGRATFDGIVWTTTKGQVLPNSSTVAGGNIS